MAKTATKPKETPKDHATGSTAVGGAPQPEHPIIDPESAPTQQQAIDEAYKTLSTVFRWGPLNSDFHANVEQTLRDLKPYATPGIGY